MSEYEHLTWFINLCTDEIAETVPWDLDALAGWRESRKAAANDLRWASKEPGSFRA